MEGEYRPWRPRAQSDGFPFWRLVWAVALGIIIAGVILSVCGALVSFAALKVMNDNARQVVVRMPPIPAASPRPAPAPATPQRPVPAKEAPGSQCPAGQCAGTINGRVICVPCR